MNFVSFKQLHEDVRVFAAQLPEVDMIIGIPRSGLLIANLIALQKNIPLGVVDSNKGYLHLKGGLRDTLQDKARLLVVDDSVASGTSMENARKMMVGIPAAIGYAGMYIQESARGLVDYYYKVVEQPRIFEWNFMHSGALEEACVDIDGVLCPDGDGSYDGPAWHVPRYTIHSIVTGRQESRREHTEKWLKNNGIKFRYLMMRPDNSVSCEAFKAKYYKASDTKVFIESALNQAEHIRDFAQKPVLCTDVMAIL